VKAANYRKKENPRWGMGGQNLGNAYEAEVIRNVRTKENRIYKWNAPTPAGEKLRARVWGKSRGSQGRGNT